MPVLTFDDTPKRFILPSFEGKNDQAWVEMKTYPLCADDYPQYYDALFLYREAVKQDPSLKEPVLNYYILARRITDWNWTDANGAKLPITVENISHFRLADIAFLILKIEDEAPEDLSNPKDGTSSATSSASTTASQ